jgi:hypothetical protein
MQSLDALSQVLPPLSEEQQEQYAYTREIYGTSRMLLACLPPELLKLTITSYGSVEFHELLRPLRDIRPVNGGPAWSEELWLQLVALNYQFTFEE